MEKNKFLDQILNDHNPVKPIQNTNKDLIKTILITFLYVSVVVYSMGFRDDLAQVFKTLVFNIEGFFLIMTVVLGIFVCLISVRPGLIELKKYKYLSKVLWGRALLLTGNWVVSFLHSPSHVVFSLNYGADRITEVLLITAIPLIWLLFQMRKGLMTHPWMSSFAVAITIGALSTLCLHLACCPFHPAQIFVWHFLSGFVIAICAGHISANT